MTWDPQLTLDVPPMDHQHRSLVELVNKLFQALKEGQAQDIMAEFEAGRASIGIDLMIFLRDWLVNHIQVEDRQYAACRHNRRSQERPSPSEQDSHKGNGLPPEEAGRCHCRAGKPLNEEAQFSTGCSSLAASSAASCSSCRLFHSSARASSSGRVWAWRNSSRASCSWVSASMAMR